MFSLTAMVFVLSAMPLGRVADRVGLTPLFLGGYVLLAGLYLWMAFGPAPTWQTGVIAVALMGLHYAVTDGVLTAAAARLLDPRVRTTGLAVLATAMGLMRIASSWAYGWLWQSAGQGTAIAVFSIGMACCCAAACLTLGFNRRSNPLLVFE